MPTASVSLEIRSWMSGAPASISRASCSLTGSATSPALCRNGVIRAAKSAGSSARILSPLIASSLAASNWAAFLLTRARSNSAAISASVKDSRFSSRRPPEQRQVIADRLGEESLVPVPVDRHHPVSFGKPLSIFAQDVGQVGERGELAVGDAHGAVDRDLARGGGEQVLPAHHVGDLHQHVIDRDGQRVQRRSVGPHEHEIGDVRVVHGDLAEDEVGERGRTRLASGT